jgi:sigma-B regulation protein RsbU (phosphoserine phosphatase)
MCVKQGTYKILVVDDEPDVEPLVLQRMRRDIRSRKYEFVFAHNGVEAVELLNKDEDIDMVISDINMPQMDGLTLLEQISEINPNIRSIIVSAYGDMKNIRTAMNRGAFDFVTKPLDFGDLRVTIERTLRHMEEWREALSSRDKLVALQNELDVASGIQQSILPTVFPSRDDYQIYASMEPARNVGGDFFDVVRLEGGRVGLAIADVSDKGVPAALFMMSSRTWMKGAAISSPEPGTVLGEVNALLHEDNETQMFVTVLYAVYDPETGEFTYASGGHDAPLLVHPDGSSELLPLTGGIALGIVSDLAYGQNSVVLDHGDTLVLYTDGVTEAMNGEGEQFGIERLRKVFSDRAPKDANEAAHKIFEAVNTFADGAAQSDDITCLTLRRSETPD